MLSEIVLECRSVSEISEPVSGEGVEHLSQGDRDQVATTSDLSGTNLQSNNPVFVTSSSLPTVDSTGLGTTSSSHVTVTRTGSGASGASTMNLGLMEGKQRCCFKHLYLLKLHEIKRVCCGHPVCHLFGILSLAFHLLLTLFNRF